MGIADTSTGYPAHKTTSLLALIYCLTFKLMHVLLYYQPILVKTTIPTEPRKISVHSHRFIHTLCTMPTSNVSGFGKRASNARRLIKECRYILEESRKLLVDIQTLEAQITPVGDIKSNFESPSFSHSGCAPAVQNMTGVPNDPEDTPTKESKVAALRLYKKALKLYDAGSFPNAQRILDRSLKLCFTNQAQDLAEKIESANSRKRRPSNEDMGIPSDATRSQLHLKADVVTKASRRGRRASVVISDIEGKAQAEMQRIAHLDGLRANQGKAEGVTRESNYQTINFKEEFGDSSDEEEDETEDDWSQWDGTASKPVRVFPGTSADNSSRQNIGRRVSESVKISTSESLRNITIENEDGGEEVHDISSGVLMIGDLKFVRPSPKVFESDESLSREPIRLEGMLWKAPTAKNFYGFGRWRMRHFILTDHLLVYSASKEATVPRGMVDFTGGIVGSAIVSKKNRRRKKRPTPFEFQVVTKDLTFYLCALNKADMDKWTAALTHNISLLSFREVEKLKKPGRSVLCMQKAPLASRKSTPPPPPLPVGVRPPPPPPLENDQSESAGPGRTALYRSHSTVNDKNSYQRLGVTRHATPGEVKRAYYKLARDFHPDKNPDADPHVFAEINKAYSTLKGEEARRKYDKSLKTKEVTRSGFCCHVVTNLHRKRPKVRECEVWSVRRTRLDFENYKAGHDTQILYWAKPGKGIPSNKAVDFAEYRYVMELWRGEERAGIKWPKSIEATRSIVFVGKKLYEPFALTLDTEEARNTMLEGLRLVRCAGSLVFTKKWKKMQESGHQ